MRREVIGAGNDHEVLLVSLQSSMIVTNEERTRGKHLCCCTTCTGRATSRTEYRTRFHSVTGTGCTLPFTPMVSAGSDSVTSTSASRDCLSDTTRQGVGHAPSCATAFLTRLGHHSRTCRTYHTYERYFLFYYSATSHRRLQPHIDGATGTLPCAFPAEAAVALGEVRPIQPLPPLAV